MRIARPRTLRVTVGLLVVSLVGLLMVSALATGLARLRVASAQHVLDTRAFPAHQAATDLGKAYVDQETGQRGYLLTGDPRFLEPYTSGVAAAGQLTGELQRLLADDPDGLRVLQAVTDAATVWRTTIAEPEIAARRRGPVPPGKEETIGLNGKARFDQLRARLAGLDTRTSALFSAQVASIGRAQATANAITIAAVAVALVVAGAGAVLHRQRFSRPLNRLIGQVQSVADGNYDAPITPAGSLELVLIADSVDRMRRSIVDHGRELVATQKQLILRQEHDRLATDLHDLTIQRVFALGLSLTSISRRHPDTAAALAPLISETDRIIREVRSVIFDLGHGEGSAGLRRQIADLAEDSARALGFAPTVDFAGPVDAVPEDIGNAAVAVLREALSNVARHAAATAAEIRVSAVDGGLTVVVADDGTGPGAGLPGDGIGRIQARAARLGGAATVAPAAGGGTVVEWRVPLAG